MMTGTIEIFAFFAGLLCTVSFTPQVIKIYKERNPKAISLGTFIILGIGISLWFSVGFMLKSPSMMFWNGVQVLQIIAIAVMKYKFSKKQTREAGEWHGSRHMP